MKATRARGYVGPLVVLTPDEVREVYAALDGRDNDTAQAARAKCAAAIGHHDAGPTR